MKTLDTYRTSAGMGRLGLILLLLAAFVLAGPASRPGHRILAAPGAQATATPAPETEAEAPTQRLRRLLADNTSTPASSEPADEDVTATVTPVATSPAVSPTGSVTETLESNIATLRAGQPLLAEAFTEMGERWQIADEVEWLELDTTAGELWFVVEQEGMLQWVMLQDIPTRTLTHYLIEVEASPTLASTRNPNNYGLVFEMKQSDEDLTYYLYTLRGPLYSLRKLENGQWRDLVELTPAPPAHFTRRGGNRLGVYVSPEAIGLLINGHLIHHLPHSEPLEGVLGLAAGTFEQGSIEVAFTDLQIWAETNPATNAESAPTPTPQAEVTVSVPTTGTITSAAVTATLSSTVAPTVMPTVMPTVTVTPVVTVSETTSPAATATPTATRPPRREPGTSLRTPTPVPALTPPTTPTHPDAPEDGVTDDEATEALESEAQTDTIPTGWDRFADEAFTLLHPAGWKIERNRDDRIDVTGPDGVYMSVWPLFLPQSIDAEPAALLLDALARDDLPTATWGEIELLEGNVLRISGSRADLTSVAALNWVATPQGTGIAYFLFVAPTAEYSRLETTFAAVLQSLEIFGAPAAVSAHESIEYVAWQDPNEASFATQVPAQGWQVEGGLIRNSALELRSWMRLLDVERDMIVFVNDTNLPMMYTTPNEIHASVGMHEGSWTTTSAGSPMLISRYIPAVDFVTFYVTEMWSEYGCVITESDTLPELEEAVITAMGGPQTLEMMGIWLDMGYANFRCEAGDHVYLGSVSAHTQMLYGDGIGMWYIALLAGHLAPEAYADEATAILENLLKNWRVDPQWQANQNRLAGTVSQININTSAEISEMLNESFANRMASEDRMQQSWSDMMREVERVEDTRTGQVYEVQTGSNYHWIDNQSNIVGTDAHFNPNGLYFEEMISAP